MTAASVRVVFDTNILISGHFWNGPPYRCMLAVEAGLAMLVLSEPILTEFGEKLTNKFGVSKSEADPIIARWAARAEVARIEGKAGWVPEDQMTIGSSRRHSSVEPQSSCQEIITFWRWAKSKGSRS